MDLFAAGLSEMSAGRVSAAAAGIVALVGVGFGMLALSRRVARGALIAGICGVVAIAVGALVAATADGGLGTGNGLGGAVVAIVAGMISLALGAWAHMRNTAPLR